MTEQVAVPLPSASSEREVTYESAPIAKRLIAVSVDFALFLGVFGLVSFLALWILTVIWREDLGRLAAVGGFDSKDPEVLFSAAPGFFFWLYGTVGVMIFGSMLAAHAYFIHFETKTGATLGKRWLGLKVVSIDGSPITRRQAFWREMGRWYLDISFVLPTVIAMAATQKRQRIGDLLAKTWVVQDPARNARSSRSSTG